MHWEFCNGTWAAKSGDNVYGVQVTEQGDFVPVFPDGSRGAPVTFATSARSVCESHAAGLSFKNSELFKKLEQFVSDMTYIDATVVKAAFPEVTKHIIDAAYRIVKTGDATARQVMPVESTN